MLFTSLFVISMLCCIMFAIRALSILVDNSLTTPVPLLYKLGISYDNTYISSPAIAYQVWFWFSHYGII